MIKYYKTSKSRERQTNIIPTRAGAFLICFLLFVSLFSFFLTSVFDKDKTVSQKENRNLEAAPKLSVVSVFNGSFAKDFDNYYADTFPQREFFLEVNSAVAGFFSKTGSGDDKMVIVEKQDKDDFAGQNITYDEK